MASLALLPLSYKMRYITDKEETIHASYNMRGKDFQQDFFDILQVSRVIEDFSSMDIIFYIQ